MGTNFYIKDAMAEEDEDMLHIGKRSCGWAFALRTYPADGIYYLHHWEQRLFEAHQDHYETIVDEYDNEISWLDMVNIIDNPEWEVKYKRASELDDPEYGLEIHARCGHYDLVEGEFC